MDLGALLPWSSSREVRIRVPFFVVYSSRGTLPPKVGKRALLGDLVLLRVGPGSFGSDPFCFEGVVVLETPPKRSRSLGQQSAPFFV